MKKLLIVLVAVIVLTGCLGLERKQDKCMIEVLETYAQDVERLGELINKVGLDEYAHMAKLQAQDLDRRAKSCIW